MMITGGTMTPDIVIIAGVSGSGKTYRRKLKYPDQPYVDVADIYRDLPWASWSEVTVAAATKARKLLAQARPVIIEGYFLPGSASLCSLRENLSGLRIKYELCTASKDTCVQRVIESGENVGLRLELIERTWKGVYAEA